MTVKNKYNYMLSELRVIHKVLAKMRENLNKSKNEKEFRQLDSEEQGNIDAIADDIKCEAKWLGERIAYIRNS